MLNSAIIKLELIDGCQMDDSGEEMSCDEACPETTSSIWDVLIICVGICLLAILGCDLVNQTVEVVFREGIPRVLEVDVLISNNDLNLD